MAAAAAIRSPARGSRLPVTLATARALALGLPETTEGAHEGLPTFHVRGKRLATLGWPDADSVTLQLAAADQAVMVAAAPAVFATRPGGWGVRGHTRMNLAAADRETALSGLTAVSRNKAPATLVRLAGVKLATARSFR